MLRGLTRSLMVAALAASLTLAAVAQEFTLRATANSNENDEDYDGLVVFKNFVEQASNGAIAVELFIGTQLCANGAECLQGVADGTIDIFTSTSAFLVGDVFGYFTDDTAAASPDGLFVPTTPMRAMDSRPTRENFSLDRFIDGVPFRSV